ncbi:hypothetical protein [Streptomyces sp. NPDC017964]|uniref:hypothetical protein n=1 Tax=Streptomyces sp. NPDC017964 TaxID=3365022 RepID=UPI0037886BBC
MVIFVPICFRPIVPPNSALSNCWAPTTTRCPEERPIIKMMVNQSINGGVPLCRIPNFHQV